MEPIFSLALDLPPAGSRERLRTLHRQLRLAILDGRLQPGLRLPATRMLATALGVSRNTVVAAYDLLLSEGYLAGRRGAGTFVAAALPQRARTLTPNETPGGDPRLTEFWRVFAPLRHASRHIPERFDFRMGLPDKPRFPAEIWRRLSARALRAVSREKSSYADPAGRPALRHAIAQHLSFTRAVACTAEDMVVTAGAQQGFDLLARLFVTPGRTVVAVEEPGYPPARAAFAAAGAEIVGVPVDAEGLVTERLPARAQVIYVTPSHQFPLGAALSPRRRAALLDHAVAHNAVVIEDDYDGEFCYGGRPREALQTLDRTGCVFYVGTFSKSLLPALRLGFVVAPAWARPALIQARQLADSHSPILSQECLAAFIAEGHLARHIRKMRGIYGERRATLLQSLARHCGDRLAILPADAGLHLSAMLTGPIAAGTVVACAAQAGIGLQTLDQFALAAGRPNGLAFGFGAIQAAQIDEAIAELARLMR
jgi:GntR family transcriptional regulator / MocR family aminotransferase